jgi:hypothetical protein
LPAGPQRYLRAHAGLPNTLSLRELPFQPSVRGQLPDGNADSERVIDMSEAKSLKGDLHMEAHQSLGRAVWAGLAAAALATTAHAQVDPGVRGGTPGAGLPFGDLTSNENSFFEVGQDDFGEAAATAWARVSTWMVAPAVTCSPRSAVLRRQ